MKKYICRIAPRFVVIVSFSLITTYVCAFFLLYERIKVRTNSGYLSFWVMKNDVPGFWYPVVDFLYDPIRLRLVCDQSAWDATKVEL
jgi:hypothetical protein